MMKQTFERKSKVRDIPVVALFLFFLLFLSSGTPIFRSVIVRVATMVVLLLIAAFGIRVLFDRYRNWWTSIDLCRDGITVHYPRQNVFFPLPDSIKRFEVTGEGLELRLEYGQQQFRLLTTDFLQKTEVIAALEKKLDLIQFASDGTICSAEFADVIAEADRPERFSPRIAAIIIVGTVAYFATFLLVDVISPKSGVFIYQIATVIWVIGLIAGIAIGRQEPKKKVAIIKKHRGKPQADARSPHG